MRLRLTTVAIVVSLFAASGCGSDSSDETTHPGASNPESGTQSFGGFPGAGSPTASDITTSPGPAPEKSKGKPGGGSSATCIGC
jgi:hypothetical protein